MIVIKCILAFLFSIILRIRHWLFDVGFIKSHTFSVPVINVGNLKMGGTGKTPMTDFIVASLKRKYRIAVVSRGYKRKTTGYVVADENATCQSIGDEPMLIHMRHPDIVVAVCEKRAEGIRKVLIDNPYVNLIILDDAFQHRYVETTIDILLTEYDKSYMSDNLFPRGSLRDLRCQADRASFIVVTKCPENIKPIQLRIFMENLNLKPYQSVFYTSMVEGEMFPLFDRGYENDIITILKGDKVVLMTGIANPTYLKNTIAERYNLIESFFFKDHHDFSLAEISKVIIKAKENNAYIVMTEKDAIKIGKLDIPSEDKYRFFVAPISISFISNDNNSIDRYFIDSLTKRLHSNNGKYCINNRRFNV